MLFTDESLRTAVGQWTAENIEGWYVDVTQDLDIFRIVARRKKRVTNITDCGQGLQQVLPVVALCCWRKSSSSGIPSIDIIEQPELHLHDAAHASLGDLLLSAVDTGPGSIVVETHSEALLLRVRRRVAEGQVDPNRVSIVYVEDAGEGSRIRPIRLTSSGEVEWWPEGVFSEAFAEVKAIGRAQRRRVKN